MFYDRFIELCNHKGVSPTKAALESGINKASVTYWKKKRECGLDTDPDQEVIHKLCAYFQCSQAWLRGLEETEKAPTMEGGRKISDDELMAAFFNGGADDLSREEMAEMWEDAREYIQYKLAQRRRKNNG